MVKTELHFRSQDLINSKLNISFGICESLKTEVSYFQIGRQYFQNNHTRNN